MRVVTKFIPTGDSFGFVRLLRILRAKRGWLVLLVVQSCVERCLAWVPTCRRKPRTGFSSHVTDCMNRMWELLGIWACISPVQNGWYLDLAWSSCFKKVMQCRNTSTNQLVRSHNNGTNYRIYDA